MRSKKSKVILGCLSMALAAALLYLLSAAGSWAVCKCFGLPWTWKTGVGVMIVWLSLYVTLHIFFYGIDAEEDEE